MAEPNPSTLALSEPERQTLDQWLAEFNLTWHEGALAVRMQELSALPEALHFPALVEMVKIDVERQWQNGQRVSLESYLEAYPQLGSPYTVPADLIQAEFEARQRQGEGADLGDFGRRFPGRTSELRRLLDQTQAAVNRVVSDPQRETPPPLSPTISRPRMSQSPAVGLPEQFGRYRILRKLGQGGMGTVYLAHDDQFDRPVALKVPHFGPDDGPEVIERFYREAKAAAVLHHPNFCPMYDVGQIDGTPYLTMAYLEGKSLAETVRHQPLPPDRATDLVRKLALALEEAHQRGVIHRDLKPSNVLLTERGEPVVLDFGLARRTGRGDVRLTQTGALVGTPAYLAPEQISGKTEPTPACDIYSLGALLYEVLTGQPPFQGTLDAVLAAVLLDAPPPPSSLRPEVGPELDVVCRKVLAKKPEERYPSMAAFAAALDECKQGVAVLPLDGFQRSSPAAAPESTVTLLPTPDERAAPRPRRRRRSWVPVAIGVLAVLLVGLLGIFTWSKINTGTVQIEVDVAGAAVFVDGEPIAEKDVGGRLRLPVGEHWVVVKHDGIAMAKKQVTVKRWEHEVVEIPIAEQVAAERAKATDPALEAVKSFTGLAGNMFNTFGKIAVDSHNEFLKEKGETEKRFNKEPDFPDFFKRLHEDP